MDKKSILQKCQYGFWNITKKWYFWLIFYVILITLLAYQKFLITPAYYEGVNPVYPIDGKYITSLNLFISDLLEIAYLFPIYILVVFLGFIVGFFAPFSILIYYPFLIYLIIKINAQKNINKKLIIIIFVVIIIQFIFAWFFIFNPLDIYWGA